MKSGLYLSTLIFSLLVAFSTRAELAGSDVVFASFDNAILLSEEELAGYSGAAGFNPAVLNTVSNVAVNTGNSINNAVGGTNIINNDAFSASSGIISVVQNSGNGVVIQNSTVVNLTMH